MNTIKALLFTALLAFTFGAPVSSSAGPTEAKRVARLEKQAELFKHRVTRQFNRLSAPDKVRAISRSVSTSSDSDGDGVADDYERLAGRCDIDSDDDGLEDGQEYEDGLDPNDDDSDDDGHSDGSEFEVKGIIESISGDLITVAAQGFIIGSTTVFRGENNEILDSNAFAAGDCVEIEGHIIGADLSADKVSKDDDC